MKGRGVFNRRGRWQRLLLITLLAASGAAVLIAATPAPAPLPFPPVLQVYKDTFNSATTFAKYNGFGGASVAINAGRLWVSPPVGGATGPAGLRMRLPRNSRGVRCMEMSGLDIIMPPEQPMSWTFFGYSDTSGTQVNLLEMEITELQTRTDVLSFRFKKANGEVVFAHHETDKKRKNIKKIQWDKRNNGTEVQCEVEYDDGTKWNSPWMDPEAGTFAGVDVSTGDGEMSVDTSGGAEVHTEGDAAQPAPILPFEHQALTSQEPYWLIQTFDAETIVSATVDRVTGVSPIPIAKDPRPRLKVIYRLDEALYGVPTGTRFVVYHALSTRSDAAQFEPGRRLILFIRPNPAGATGNWFWDSGRPTGVLPSSTHNIKAVASRIAFIRGGQPS